MIYRALFRLVLQRIPAVIAHSLAVNLSRLVLPTRGVRRILRRLTLPAGGLLTVRALGTTFPSPLGAGAGLDKNVSWFEQLGATGFGFVEVGTITPSEQKPNPGTPIRRLPQDRALLNRLGFPNPGVENAAERLRNRAGETIVGSNIGKARDTPVAEAADDYCAVARQLASVSDYLVINVSSPNTVGLRELETTELLRPLIGAVQRELNVMNLRTPLLIKISPDLSDEQLDSITDLAIETAVDGIVATNTTVDRTGLSTPIDESTWSGGGGISGAPLKARALEILHRLYARVGDRLVLISIGGIETPDDVWDRIVGGATLVQAYTGFIYGGPGWPRQLNRALEQRVRETGASSIQELIGSAVRPVKQGSSVALASI